jgi:hypothetical protein
MTSVSAAWHRSGSGYYRSLDCRKTYGEDDEGRNDPLGNLRHPQATLPYRYRLQRRLQDPWTPDYPWICWIPLRSDVSYENCSGVVDKRSRDIWH